MVIKTLQCILFEKSKKYDTEYKVHEAKVKNHCVNFDCQNFKLGDTNFLEISLNYPCKKVIGKDYLKDNLLFVKKMIYNPIYENGLLNPRLINILKNLYKDDINTIYEDSFEYYDYINTRLIDEDNLLIDIYKDNPKLIDRITPEYVTNTYKNIIKQKPIVSLVGNISKQSKKIIMDNFYDNKIEKIKFDGDYNHFFKNIPSKTIIKREYTNYQTSIVYYNFKVKNPVERDKTILYTIKKLLFSHHSMLLFDELRLKKDLVYNCGVKNNVERLSISMWASCGKSKINDVKATLDKIINLLKTKEYVNKKLNDYNKKIDESNSFDEEEIDDMLYLKFFEYVDYFNKELNQDSSKVTANEIINFICNKLVLVSIYEGVGLDE